MTKLLKAILLIIIKQFKFFWILITIILLSFTLYINWTLSLNRSYNELSNLASTISNHVDGFVEDLFQEVYTLPIYGKNLTDCKSGLYPYLQHIVLNIPNIAALSIVDNKKQFICSTLPEDETIISASTRARTITGPFKLSVFDESLFLIQQKMGNYHIGIFVVSSILQNVLKTTDKAADSIALYNSSEKKNIIRIEKSTSHNRWVVSNNLNTQTPLNTNLLYSIDKTQSIDGVGIVVFEKKSTVLNKLWQSEFLASLFILCSSIIMYFLFKKIITNRYSLQGALKAAIKNNEFYPEYQPLYHCEKDRLSGVEVLVRWKDSEDQLIMPDLFISEAEASGLIIPITLQIVEISLKEIESLLKDDPDFHLAFNLSAWHFTDPVFFDTFNILIKQFAVNPNQILLEITERELLDKNNSIFIGTMQKLRSEGYSLAVDDYGTGHASISYLQHFPFNYLKIDKLFIQAIGTKAITESLNDAIIQMAKGLNLIIIAEGVETEEQVNYLSDNGVQLLQGWYFSKAVSIEKLLTLLKGEKE
ncbi:EAL domain-containing protein [uncultured Legionella sp.]|uniref:EAL domain-containing protein n=1 Tax=uncultured Legionella sp. TaxID=210934 RepID=UPI002602F8A5|nr:EAL domain-containing protein [uncultured Legionella sp.]